MDTEVKKEEVTDDEQIPIEPKQEVDESVEIIEPKVELIDEMDVKKEEFDDNEYQHMIPYEYRDYMEQHIKEELPANSSKRKADDSSSRSKDPMKCRRCEKAISSSNWTNVRSHAIRHTSLKMYECPASQCSFKEYQRANVSDHMKRKHKSCTDPVIKNEMTDQDKQILENMIHECFPEQVIKLIKLNNVNCQLCNRCVKDCEKTKKAHANEHIYPILFKCNEQNCNFSSNFFDSFAIHSFYKHKKQCHPNHKTHLIMKQETETQKWNEMCFPNKDVVGVISTEKVDLSQFTDETIVDVKKEETADDGQMPTLIDPKKEVIDESWELLEPKVESIDEMDVKTEEIDNSNYQHIIPYEDRDYTEEIDDNEYQHMIPFEYRDYLKQNTEEHPKRKRPAADSSMSEGNSSECQKCGISVSFHVKRHAIRHTSLKLYECPVNQCSFKANDSSVVTTHMKREHKSCTDPVRKIEMSNEEKQVLENMVHECFPKREAIKLQGNVKCQLCHRFVKNSDNAKKTHSMRHIDPLLFNCNEEDCEFSTNWFHFFASHVYGKHNKTIYPNDREHQLIKQEMEMQKWNDKCFLNKNVKETDSNIVVEQDGYTCQICKKAINEDGCDTNRRIHASEHMDILFCSVPSCQFQTKYLVAMNNHQLTVHVSEPASSSGTSLRFMTAQEWGIERMLGRCFPELIKK